MREQLVYGHLDLLLKLRCLEIFSGICQFYRHFEILHFHLAENIKKNISNYRDRTFTVKLTIEGHEQISRYVVNAATGPLMLGACGHVLGVLQEYFSL